MTVIQSILGMITDDFLVELTQKELRVFSFSSDTTYVDEPHIAIEYENGTQTVKAVGSDSKKYAGPNVKIINPFSHSRSMISSFTYAEKILQFGFKSLHKKMFQASPRVVMHQLEKNEGGLTEVEERVLRELAIGAGAREVIVYQGAQINPKVETFDSVKSRISAP